MPAFLAYDQQGPIVTLTMNSPETRNVLTGNSAADEFVAACARIDADASVRAVILTGAGPAFSAGGDLKGMQKMLDMPQAEIRQWYRQGIQRVTLAVHGLEVPIIAAVNGPAIGAGIFLMLKHVVSSFTDYWALCVGTVFILCVMFLPQGIWGWARARFGRRP